MPDAEWGAVLEELYALPLTEFTTARDELAAESSSGSRVTALRRPSPSAWLINQLVRHRAEELRATLALGDRLRDAQDRLDAPELARLARDRRRLVAALVQQAKDVAVELGQKASAAALNEVGDTLTAALSDAAATDSVMSGRLLRSLVSVGLDPVDLAGAVAGGEAAEPPASARRLRAVDPEEKARRTRLRRAVEDAAAELASAEAGLDEIDRRMVRSGRRLDDLRGELSELEEQLRAVKSDIAAAERDARALEKEHDRAGRAVDDARVEWESAKNALGEE